MNDLMIGGSTMTWWLGGFRTSPSQLLGLGPPHAVPSGIVRDRLVGGPVDRHDFLWGKSMGKTWTLFGMHHQPW